MAVSAEQSRVSRADLGRIRETRTTRSKRKTRLFLSEIARLPLYGVVLLMLLPFLYMVLGSFKPAGELQQLPPTVLPSRPTLGNYSALVTDWPGVLGGFWRFVGNSLLVASLITVLSVVLASLAAYVITQSTLPGRRIVFLVVIATMMVPWQTTIIPNYLMVRSLGWINTFAAYIVPSLASAFLVFFLVQYMRTIPNELIQAARLDGAGEWTILARIAFPLTWPAIASMSIFTFIAQWNSFVWPLVVVQSDDMKNVPLALAELSRLADPTQYPVLLAAATVVSLPLIALFFMFQRYFVRGIMLQGIKG